MTSAPDLPTEPSEPTPEAEPSREGPAALTRRSFVVRAMAAIGALIAAIVAIPVAGFAAMPFFRARTPISLLSGMVPPTLRSEAWADAGPVDDFKVGEPHLVPLQREVIDGWVTGAGHRGGVRRPRDGDRRPRLRHPLHTPRLSALVQQWRGQVRVPVSRRQLRHRGQRDRRTAAPTDDPVRDAGRGRRSSRSGTLEPGA